MTLSIRNKILLGLIALVLLNFLVLAISFFYLIGLGRSAEGILKENYESIEAVRTMERAQSRQHLLLSGPPLERGTFSALYEAEMAFMEGYHRARGNLTLPEKSCSGVVILEGEKIVSVEEDGPVLSDASWIVPGFIDIHFHGLG
ncbi:MAG: hypothetical protein EOM65_16010, partial [Synergistales bacterium]|nr:hypothetical protein [Synergistales bacterium]